MAPSHCWRSAASCQEGTSMPLAETSTGWRKPAARISARSMSLVACQAAAPASAAGVQEPGGKPFLPTRPTQGISRQHAAGADHQRAAACAAPRDGRIPARGARGHGDARREMPRRPAPHAIRWKRATTRRRTWEILGRTAASADRPRRRQRISGRSDPGRAWPGRAPERKRRARPISGRCPAERRRSALCGNG